MGDVMVRLGAAINGHDLEAFVALFADEYQSEQPAHPTRSFHGVDKVRENWASVFAGIPNLRAELLTSATTRDGGLNRGHATGRCCVWRCDPRPPGLRNEAAYGQRKERAAR